MCAQEKKSGLEGKKRSSVFKVIKWLSVVILVILVLVVFGVPWYLSSSGGKGFIVNKVNRSIDGQIGMGELSVGWVKGVRVSDFSFDDDAGGTSVNVKEISARPHYSSLLVGNVSFDDVVLDSPDVIVNIKDDGQVGDFESDKARGIKKTSKKEAGGLNLDQIDLTVKNGNVTINHIDVDDQVQTLHFKNIESRVDINKPGSESEFDVALAVAGNGKESDITARGSIDRPAKKKWSLAETDGDISVKVDKLDLETLGPVFVLLGRKMDISGIANVDASVEIDDGKIEDLSVNAVIDGFSQVVDGRAISVDEPVVLKAKAGEEDDEIVVKNFELTSSFCNITASGTARDIKYIAKADIGRTMDFVGTFVDMGGYRFAGTGVEEGNISIDGDRIRFSDHSTVDNFVIKKTGKGSSPAVSAKFTFDMTVDTAKNNLKIDSLTMKTTDAMADVDVYDSQLWWGEEADRKMDLNVKAEILLEKAEMFARFFEVIPGEMDIAGAVKSDLSIKSVKDGIRVVTENTRISNLKVEAEGAEKAFEDKLVNVAFDGVIGPEKRNFAFKVDGSQIDIEGKFEQEAVKEGVAKLAGGAVAKYDLADVSTLASAYLPEGLTMRGKRSDVIRFQSVYPADQPDKRFANMDASAEFGFDSAEYMGMNIGKADVNLKIDRGVVELSPFSTTVNKGRFNFAGSMDLNQKPIVFKTPGPIRVVENININEKMGRELLKYLNPIFAKQGDLTGVANFRCDKLVLPVGGQESIRDAEIRGVVAISGMSMKLKGLLGQTLQFARTKPTVYADLLPAEFAMQRGVLSYNNMQVNIDRTYPLNFRGSVDLAGRHKKLDMQVALPYRVEFEGLEPKFRTIKIGESTRDRVVLPIEGTVDNNKIDFDEFLKGLIGRGAEQLLRQQLEKGLRDLF